MSILIRGMEMPKVCLECPCCDVPYKLCKAERPIMLVQPYDDPPAWCPLIPLPEGHGRLGDLDKINANLEDMLKIRYNEKVAPYSWSHAYIEMQRILNKAPIIVPAEGGTDDD